ncbi:MAG TPA: hypothetical protein VKF62_01835 [Planctomycetota bacterium]|nr:hypothetical protein [Planctomycetota bacterium]
MLPLSSFRLVLLGSVAAFAAAPSPPGHTTSPFKGAKVNGGTATHSVEGGQHRLTLSDDFRTPDAPDVHWQVVDSMGNAFLLNRLAIKGDKMNRSVTLPSEVHDVAKVQMWCAWAQVVLGDASFESPLATEASGTKEGRKTTTLPTTSKPFTGVKANKGTVAAKREGENLVLALSEDFVTPDTPDVHWQVVDSMGHAHLLQRVKVKGDGKEDRMQRTITVPSHVPDVAKVQMWCAFAETNLGEAAFDSAVR